MRSRARALLAAVFLFLAGSAFAADARDDAARLAILAEHLGKVHAQVVHGVGAERGRRALGQAMRDFDQGLRAAASRAPASMQDHYALLTLLWREHRAWLAKPPVRDPARAEAERDEELTYLTLKGSRLAGPLPGSAGEAAHAARLSQRVARLAILARAAGTSADEPSKALAELREALAKLDAAGADPAFAAEIQVARNQFLFLERALETPGHGTRELDVAVRSADNILEALQRAMRQAEPAARTTPG